MKYVDLNSDLGEGFGNYKSFEDKRIYNIITSANVACGYHAGDPLIMDSTIKLCLKSKVGIGAHPGFPDLMGFGRRKMELAKEEAACYSMYQVGALSGMAMACGGNIQHVKLHGAFYNMVMANYEQSKYIINYVKGFDPNIIFLGLSNSKFIEACKDEGVRYAREVFADRTYNDDGSLVPRSHPNSIIRDKEKALEQVKRIVLYGEVVSLYGKVIKLEADSICIHGDNENALSFAELLKGSLENENIKFASLESFI